MANQILRFWLENNGRSGKKTIKRFDKGMN